MVKIPLYHPRSIQLSQHGVWEHGQSSGTDTFEQGGSSQPPSQNLISEVEDLTQGMTEIIVRRP
jgi:hypothetical protein